MATATSLTTERILELAAGWTSVEQAQADVAAIVVDLKTIVDETNQDVKELTQTTIPTLQENDAARDIDVADLRDNAIPNLQQSVDSNAAEIEDINTVTVPGIQADVESQYQVLVEIPHVFNQTEAPVDGDDEDRPLMIGDRWFDDAQQEHLWNGTEWVVAGLEIPDLSITVQKFKTSTHQLY